ncbi:MAG: alpha/beta hydrolase fold domain-containing protein [Terrimonas sp.]|nr:alpha/beta hydrolase fold domain-containing protein [Terrimonas sp.]
MQRILCICISVVITGHLIAQSVAGITGIPDTGFTIQHEFSRLRKNYPFIAIASHPDDPAISVKRDITYCTVGPRRLQLDVFYPTALSNAKRTAIVIIHGGGWRSGNRTLHDVLAERLAAMGYICITPEYRLSTEALFPAAVDDIKSCIRWVRKNASQFNIDPQKIAALGHSAGGELAAFAGVTNDEAEFNGNGCHQKQDVAVQAVVDIDGILAFIHPESGEGDDSKSRSAATNWFGYSKSENPALWIRGSPLTYAGKQSPPFLFINSSVERMHAGRDDFIKVLAQYQIYTEVHTFEKAPHTFPFFDPWFEPMVQYIDGFLRKVFSLP